jgi:hypothetical protein
VIPAGKIERGERKRTADEVSKAFSPHSPDDALISGVACTIQI